MTMDEQPSCVFCGEPCEPWHEPPTGYGHNPEPLADWPARCCTNCNAERVVPARLGLLGYRVVEDEKGLDGREH